MNESTHHHSPRTELRLARAGLRALREDLLTHAFAFRPLPPLPVASGPLHRLPARLQAPVRWLPHAAIVLTAVAMMIVSAGGINHWEPDRQRFNVLFLGVPLIAALFRPVGAWWLSLAGLVAVALMGISAAWPWLTGALITHTLVMALVAVRSRPRVVVEMWVLTVLTSLALPTSQLGTAPGHNTLIMIAVSVPTLLAVLLVRGWHTSRREVVEQAAVTRQERSRRTRLEERTVIARELHDVVAHHMSVVAIQAEAAPYRVDNPPPELTQSFATIRENAVAALAELRRVLGVVRAEDQEAPDAPQPTLADLDRLLENVREAGLSVEKTVTGAVPELPQGVELSAYRIIQEALSNTLRHAPGASARVEVAHVLGGLGLRVVNGPPKSPAPTSPGAGHGITGMRERVSMLGGELTARPTTNGGFETTVFLPLSDSARVPA
ncbi:histidine kinase [Streptomyces sp. DSM 44915]|uniref:histidine kinase n=1 Tax=Streptomyces chisholmiae TaxID=3075540 RepID=A0ABU2JTI7_9ACTN|nr:histidine kinase [Streptomyces sp. DSM 44915]MDT0267503.1 histidine kinase [Streptomyces sp. DSM 44915]